MPEWNGKHISKEELDAKFEKLQSSRLKFRPR